VPVLLEQVAAALAAQAPQSQPVVAPVVVDGLAVAATGAVAAAGVGVAESAAGRLAESGVGRGLGALVPTFETFGASSEPGEVGLLPMWRADP
jgi:hypothetical protein